MVEVAAMMMVRVLTYTRKVAYVFRSCAFVYFSRNCVLCHFFVLVCLLVEMIMVYIVVASVVAE